MKKDQHTATKKQQKNNSDLFTSLTDLSIERISGGDNDHKEWIELISFAQSAKLTSQLR